MPGRRPAGVARLLRPVRSVRSVRPLRAAAVRSVRFFRASIRFRFSCRFGPGGDARTEMPGRLFLTSEVASTPFYRTGCRGEDRFGFCRDGERPRGACRCRRSVCSAGLPSGRSDAEYILERRSCFSPGRAQSRGLSDRIEEREATARTSRFFVSVPAADAACGARPGRAASAAGGCGSRHRRAALRESADA